MKGKEKIRNLTKKKNDPEELKKKNSRYTYTHKSDVLATEIFLLHSVKIPQIIVSYTTCWIHTKVQ